MEFSGQHRYIFQDNSYAKDPERISRLKRLDQGLQEMPPEEKNRTGQYPDVSECNERIFTIFFFFLRKYKGNY